MAAVLNQTAVFICAFIPTSPQNTDNFDVPSHIMDRTRTELTYCPSNPLKSFCGNESSFQNNNMLKNVQSVSILSGQTPKL